MSSQPPGSEFLSIQGVTGSSFDGSRVTVYVIDQSVRQRIPAFSRGYPVVVKVSGPVFRQ